MGKPREFTTAPVRAIADTRLSALDLRCLLVIALHDGMSLVRGTGAGCYAKSATLAAMAKTDITNFSKSVNRLAKLDYIVREAQPNDRRRFTLRVIYGDDDGWRNDQAIEPVEQLEEVGGSTNEHAEYVGEITNDAAEIVGDQKSESRRKPPKTTPQYISLNEEIHSVETDEINSVETAHRAFCATRIDEVSADRDLVLRAIKDGAQALAIRDVSLKAKLSPRFTKLTFEAKVAKFEELFAGINRNADAIEQQERGQWIEWLHSISEEFSGEPVGYRAQRLYEEVAPY